MTRRTNHEQEAFGIMDCQLGARNPTLRIPIGGQCGLCHVQGCLQGRWRLVRRVSRHLQIMALRGRRCAGCRLPASISCAARSACMAALLSYALPALRPPQQATPTPPPTRATRALPHGLESHRVIALPTSQHERHPDAIVNRSTDSICGHRASLMSKRRPTPAEAGGHDCSPKAIDGEQLSRIVWIRQHDLASGRAYPSLDAQ